VVDIIKEDAKKLKLTWGELVVSGIQSFHSEIKARNKWTNTLLEHCSVY
jgi:hypothetical protein